MNPVEMLDEHVDLHTQCVKDSLLILFYLISRLEERLRSGRVAFNCKNAHIFKIVTGVGNHATGEKGVLRKAIMEAFTLS